MDITVLSRTARLFLVLALNIRSPFDRLAIRYLLWNRSDVYAEPVLELCQNDRKLYVTLASKKSLVRLVTEPKTPLDSNGKNILDDFPSAIFSNDSKYLIAIRPSSGFPS